MSNIFVNSNVEIKEVKTLLNRTLPNYRQAYSDRTSWLMACISELAYVKFNPLLKDSKKDYFIKQISKLVDDSKIASLISLIDLVGYDHEEEKKRLKENVEFLGLELVQTFDHNGSQWITSHIA